MANSVTVKDLKSFFNFEQICGDESSLERLISVPETNRPGLELAGFFAHSHRVRIVILGDKEMEYLKTQTVLSKMKSFDFLTSNETPTIIISKNYACPEELMKIAQEKNFPVLRSAQNTSRIITSVITYLDEQLAPSEYYHGVLVNMFGKGILIRGESGIGKSETALELIHRGHQLVADDRVDCYKVHNKIIGRASEVLEGLLEIRGVGVMDISRMYGANCVLSKASVDLIIELTPWSKCENYDRIGIEDTKYEKIMDVSIPKIVLPVREGRSMGIVIEGAVTNMILKDKGYNSAKEFEERVVAFIEMRSQGGEVE